MEPDEEDMDQDEDNDDRKSFDDHEETASGSGEGEDQDDQEEDEDEGGSSGTEGFFPKLRISFTLLDVNLLSPLLFGQFVWWKKVVRLRVHTTDCSIGQFSV